MKCRDASEIIKLLKKEKNKQGLTNIQLAKLSGVSEGTLNKIFGTETSNPSINNILKIVDALDLPDEFFFKPNEPEQLDGNECRLLDLFRQLTPVEKGIIIGRAEQLAEAHERAFSEDAG